jgi:S1-C subfamily serine protease
MDPAKPTNWVPRIGSLIATSGIAFFGWQLTVLHGTVLEGRQEVQALRSQLDAERGERAALEHRSAEMSRRAEELARSIGEARQAFTSSGQNVGDAIERLEERTAAIDTGLAGIRSDVATAIRRLDDQSVEVRSLKRRLDAVAPGDYGALLAPTVKISSKSDVGSGTVIYSDKKGDRYVSYVLTAHHIVEQNYDPKTPLPLEVVSFREGRKVREESGIVVSVSPQLDLALIEVESDRPYEATAKLIAPEKIAAVKLYSRVNAIGCPLGYAPIPTSGELTSKSKVLDGQSYWMINAPTIFGNSGGAIYLSETHEMIGVLSRISAYKNLIDVAVPHMGIVTSMNDVYSWLEHEHYQYVVDRGVSPEEGGRDRLAEHRTPGSVTEVTGAVPPKPASVTRKAD